MWGCSNAQIFSEVSPKMHWEFALEHDLRWLRRWGLNYYGCCEPLDGNRPPEEDPQSRQGLSDSVVQDGTRRGDAGAALGDEPQAKPGDPRGGRVAP